MPYWTAILGGCGPGAWWWQARGQSGMCPCMGLLRAHRTKALRRQHRLGREPLCARCTMNSLRLQDED